MSNKYSCTDRLTNSSWPPEKNVYLKIIFLYFSTKTNVMGTQKSHLNDPQNTCFSLKLIEKMKILQGRR